MSDIYCAKCGEPWESYSLQPGIYTKGDGDLTHAEAERFLKGEGCPSCKYGTLCPGCSGTGRYGEYQCPASKPSGQHHTIGCRNGARLAWVPNNDGRGYKAGEFYIGYSPNVRHVDDPQLPPGELGKGVRDVGVLIGGHLTLDGRVNEYWILCPDCKGELEFCPDCNGSGKLTRENPEDIRAKAAESELSVSDDDPAAILDRRGLL